MGMCFHALLQRIFPTQGLNQGHLALQADYLPLNDFLDIKHLMCRKARIKTKQSKMNIRNETQSRIIRVSSATLGLDGLVEGFLLPLREPGIKGHLWTWA